MVCFAYCDDNPFPCCGSRVIIAPCESAVYGLFMLSAEVVRECRIIYLFFQYQDPFHVGHVDLFDVFSSWYKHVLRHSVSMPVHLDILNQHSSRTEHLELYPMKSSAGNNLQPVLSRLLPRFCVSSLPEAVEGTYHVQRRSIHANCMSNIIDHHVNHSL